MSFSVQAAWSPDLLGYDFGPGHPMAPVRLDLTIALARSLGLLDLPQIRWSDVEPAADDVLAAVHEPAYIAAVHAASQRGVPDLARGLGTEDDPVFTGMHEAAARIVSGTCAVTNAVWRGEATHGVNIAGGMHHAMPGAASGFCIYNDAAIAIQQLLDQGATRVAYVDLDAHHGDGVEKTFWNDPRVLTISIHQSGATLFPGTGYPTDTGGPGAPGSAVNLALPPRTHGGSWLRAIDAIVPEALAAFEPQILITQHGCDAHDDDPLSDMAVEVCAQRRAAAWMHELAHELCEGRWVALGGGGYAVRDVVPFAWTHLLAIAAHTPIDDTIAVPDDWRQYVLDVLGDEPPTTMSGADVEGTCRDYRPWRSGFDPADPIDRAISATRTAVFPLLGVLPDSY